MRNETKVPWLIATALRTLVCLLICALLVIDLREACLASPEVTVHKVALVGAIGFFILLVIWLWRRGDRNVPLKNTHGKRRFFFGSSSAYQSF